MRKSIMFHIRAEETLKNYIAILNNVKGNEDLAYSHEVKRLILDFLKVDWEVYLTTLENIEIEQGLWKNVYHITPEEFNSDALEKGERLNLNIDQVNETIDIIMIRNVGSVEGHFDELQKYLTFLIENYKGRVLNDAKAMKKGMTKHYLGEIDSEYLSTIGFKTIPTDIYETSVTMDEINSKYGNLEGYLIKPVTGELSNSLKALNEIDEQFLRNKENKVGGWIIQPIQKDIWNGEYQLVFIDNELTYCQQKQYKNDEGSNLPSQKNRQIGKYHPTDQEVENAKNLIKYMSDLYNLNIDICRIDYIKDGQGNMILLEFEMVNPGFFIGYMNDNDEDIKHIVSTILKYCEKIILAKKQ